MVSISTAASPILKLILLASTLALNAALSLQSPFSSPNGKGGASEESSIKTPVVICPGFGNDKVDYISPLSQPPEIGLVSVLQRRGFESVSIVDVSRPDWIRVAGGLFDKDFYFNEAEPTGLGYGWYLKRLKECVNEAFERSEGERVLLLGHSAGGWLARAAMSDGTWNDGVRTPERIRGLVTVGAIHRPPEGGASCVTRGALAYTDRTYPGAFLKEEGVAYVSVGGDAIVGDKSASNADPTDADRLYATRGEGSSSRVAYTSYEAVSGNGEMTGDGVVPLEYTQLDGARQVRLEGVLHSINEAGTTIPTDRWYGSEGVVDRWLPLVLEEADIASAAGRGGSGVGFGLDGLQQWATGALGVFQPMYERRG